MLHDIIENENRVRAIQIIRERTECPLSWAKIWVHHPYGGNAVLPTASCPFCGAQLRTLTARQCPSCFRSWNDSHSE